MSRMKFEPGQLWDPANSGNALDHTAIHSGHKYYLNIIWMFNFGRNILDQLWTFQQCSATNIFGMFLFDVI